MIEYRDQGGNKALLIAVCLREHSETMAKSHLKELKGLCFTLDLIHRGEFIVHLKQVHPKYFVGSGWAKEISEQARLLEADYIIFDDDLSPSQQRNLEKICQRPIIDRHQVILEIFAQRAHTKEARLQVELAQLVYNLPRLRRMWTHLSRQQGGAKGTRGEGETQLETDRRLVEARITRLKTDLKHLRSQRANLRKQRESIPIPTAAIVGYTNAGKSSLHHIFTNSQTLVENKLFATLDPTTRRHKLPAGQELLITDTVGFIRKLPHDLVDAFKSTLEETAFSHFILHLVDISSPDLYQHIRTTQSVLKEIGAADKTEILIFNKCDRVSSDLIRIIRNQYPNALFISVKTGDGIASLNEALQRQLQKTLQKVQVTLPYNRGNVVAIAHQNGQVISADYREENIVLQAYLPERILKSMSKLEIKYLHE